MKKFILIILLVVLLLSINTKAYILNKDFADMEGYDVFVLKIDGSLNTNVILDYFSEDEIVCLSLIVDELKNINFTYDGNLDNVNNYFITKVSSLDYLIDASKYENIPLKIAKIKLYTTYEKIYNLLTYYPNIMYNTNANKTYRKLSL